MNLPKSRGFGNQRQVRAPFDVQQAQRQRKDVVQRQRGNAVGLAHVSDTPERGREPGFGLQHRGHDVAMRQHRTLRQPRGAAGVLQKSDRVERAGRRFESHGRAFGDGAIEWRYLAGTALPATQRQLVRWNHFGQMTHGKSDPAAIPESQANRPSMP